jgi:hypothetical protein
MNMAWWLLLPAFALGAALAWLWRRTPRHPAAASPDPLDTVEAWHPKSMKVLSSAERRAHALLLEACPDHLVLAQVPLSRFLRVPTRHAYGDWLQRVGHHCVDLLLCTPDTQVVAVIELEQDDAHTSASRQQRLARVRRVLEGAGIAMHTLPAKRVPSAQVLRLMLLGGAPSDAVRPSAGQLRPSGDALVGFALSPRESVPPDEQSDQHEPTPSTWFDEMETTPLPTLNEPAEPLYKPR